MGRGYFIQEAGCNNSNEMVIAEKIVEYVGIWSSIDRIVRQIDITFLVI
mgnify:CR=1 FL=1